MATGSSFLFLQGPVGRFFDRLAQALRQRGHGALRINLNGGDVADWRCGGAVCFRGSAADWAGFVRDLALRLAVTDLVLFGDCRPRHRVAIRLLRPLGVRVHVFEEGYFRPHWITCEPDGVNGCSRLPRDPAFYRQAAVARPNRPWPETRPVGPAVGGLVRSTIGYYAGLTLLRPWFRQHRSHRPLGPWGETGCWIRRGLVVQRQRRLAALRQRRLLEDRRPYFVLALQLDADMQVRRHSRFAGMAEVIAHTVRSFARGAPDDARLVVKNHPLDCGRIDFERVLAREATACGVEGRTVYLDGGDLPALLDGARGLVVVNSTAGLSGIHRSLPTVVLGRALYDMPGLTHGAGEEEARKLLRFWREPEPPDPELYAGFRRVVMERTQVNGGFYTDHGIRLAVAGAVERLEAA